MSRKKTQPKKNVVPDPKFKSTIIPKLINNIMYDGKRGIAAKIVYDAIDKIKTKTKDEPINIFNEAINNIKPTVEVRSRRVGDATYQVPVEVNWQMQRGPFLRGTTPSSNSSYGSFGSLVRGASSSSSYACLASLWLAGVCSTTRSAAMAVRESLNSPLGHPAACL